MSEGWLMIPRTRFLVFCT